MKTKGRVELNYKKITPDFSGDFEWECYSKKIALEYQQSFEEGHDIEEYREVFEGVAKMPDGEEKEQIAEILMNIVYNAKIREDYPYNEPSELAEIKALRKPYDYKSREINDDELISKIKGAWLGRICGCLLGKPIECIRTDELIPLLKETGNYPMHRYILSTDITDDMHGRYRFGLKDKCWGDAVSSAPVDDDTNYTVMAQLIIDKYGKDFTTMNVADTWIGCQSRNAYFTAERIAYRNLTNGYPPPYSAIYKNPCREWIGAQIRGDYYGYINPGNPELAADMAFRDAALSHVKNGIYGEMFVSAMLACAAVCDDVNDVISGGLAQIPSTSRLYRAVKDMMENYKNGMSSEDCFAEIHKKYDEFTDHGWCHTISNAMIVTAALLYGEGDYGKSICLAVQTGFDTDCNGATVGSVIGMMKGDSAIGSEWKDVINDKVDTSIFGVGTVIISDLVKKTMEHIK